MKRLAPRVCAAIAMLLAVGILYRYGASPLSIVIAVVLLSCPVWVVWMSLRLSRQSHQDVSEAVDRELKSRKGK
ncbi:hypothetical protein [Burkholderia diffusa]|uniref:hypothetical protein n=1 Tax=Burkholderia diffusa TaxID=488732 RepID=UPI001589B82E|nr:hypothetical protein [Burkholderia diffusa]